MDKARLGAFAEHACVAGSLVAHKPRSLDFAQAAAVPLAGLTALQVLRDELRVAAGQRIFIPGGAGGVGTFAIQLARRFGADVTTTASPRGKDLVTRLGATRVVDYTAPFPTDLPKHDGAFDLVAGDALGHCFDVAKRGGRVVTIAGIPEPRTATQDLKRGFPLAARFWLASFPVRVRAWSRGVDYRYYFMRPDGKGLAELAAWIDAGELDVIIDRVFPFSHIGEAFAHLESGRAKGKVVVTFGASASHDDANHSPAALARAALLG